MFVLTTISGERRLKLAMSIRESSHLLEEELTLTACAYFRCIYYSEN